MLALSPGSPALASKCQGIHPYDMLRCEPPPLDPILGQKYLLGCPPLQ